MSTVIQGLEYSCPSTMSKGTQYLEPVPASQKDEQSKYNISNTTVSRLWVKQVQYLEQHCRSPVTQGENKRRAKQIKYLEHRCLDHKQSKYNIWDTAVLTMSKAIQYLEHHRLDHEQSKHNIWDTAVLTMSKANTILGTPLSWPWPKQMQYLGHRCLDHEQSKCNIWDTAVLTMNKANTIFGTPLSRSWTKQIQYLGHYCLLTVIVTQRRWAM